jgi:GNAT superfamily N-acetyltransferase
MSLKLRRATARDAGTIVEFNRLLALESEGKTLDVAVLRKGVDTCLQDEMKGFYTIAEQDGIAVGQTLITLEWSDWRNGWFWWIQSVYVREDARSSGVFKAIFHHLRNEAAAKDDVIGLRLYMDKGNERARKVYGSLGMMETEYELFEMYPIRT